ncbi:MAG: hypothetical protein EAZ07_08580 [Cytophagales bacterium]|nr:MAG: hypothetical protein EAZ07_08580 [Cytophagales bacterium]
MNILIYLAFIKKQEYNFNNKHLVLLKNKFPEIFFFDLDNYSKPELFQYATKAMEESTKALLFIDFIEPEKYLPTLNWIEVQLKKNKKLSLFLLNQNLPNQFSILEKKYSTQIRLFSGINEAIEDMPAFFN